MTDEPLDERLRREAIKSSRIADWIYHDVRLDCDNHADERTAQRVAAVHEEFGLDALYGLALWWATKSCWRLEDAYRLTKQPSPPKLTPKTLGEIDERSGWDGAKKRAYLTAQQFLTVVSNDDLEMSYDLFSAAWSASDQDGINLLYHVLEISIGLSNFAQHLKAHHT